MKGYLSYLVLWIVSKESMTGAQISSELQKRRGAKPSPGTIYPVLKDLKEKGLIASDCNKAYSMTRKGEKVLKSSCHAFCRMFYDFRDMIECCK
jgi:PadR family transcriptional regulator PadR